MLRASLEKRAAPAPEAERALLRGSEQSSRPLCPETDDVEDSLSDYAALDVDPIMILNALDLKLSFSGRDGTGRFLLAASVQSDAGLKGIVFRPDYILEQIIVHWRAFSRGHRQAGAQYSAIIRTRSRKLTGHGDIDGSFRLQ